MQRHRTDFGALLMGLAFLGIGSFALARDNEAVADALRWLWPIAWLAIGIGLIVSSSQRSRTDRAAAGTLPRDRFEPLAPDEVAPPEDRIEPDVPEATVPTSSSGPSGLFGTEPHRWSD